MKETATRSPWIPEGMTHLEYVLMEAKASFLKGETGLGIVGLLHALHVKDAKGEPLPEGYFSDIARAAGAWDVDR